MPHQRPPSLPLGNRVGIPVPFDRPEGPSSIAIVQPRPYGERQRHPERVDDPVVDSGPPPRRHPAELEWYLPPRADQGRVENPRPGGVGLVPLEPLPVTQHRHGQGRQVQPDVVTGDPQSLCKAHVFPPVSNKRHQSKSKKEAQVNTLAPIAFPSPSLGSNEKTSNVNSI